ncbi:MAG: hypothetical protein FWC66_10580, partial [Oscillospiraceae bacterium]|nr:hypothetical protein [Oscillospiraceae bacterium]
MKSGNSRIISGLLFICILVFVVSNVHSLFVRTQGVTAAYASSDNGDFTDSNSSAGHGWTLESAVGYATDVVVAEFVAYRTFGEYSAEYEFIIHDRIFGNAADTVFVYVIYNSMNFMSRRFADPSFQFATGTHYLLTLIKLADVYARFHDDGFMFASDMILYLDDPTRSTIYGQPLRVRSRLDFDNSDLTSEQIISYVRSLPRHPMYTIDRVFITSDDLRDIVTGSPYVIVIEINEPRRLASEAIQSDISATDIYFVTVVEVLKGNMQVGDELRVIFFADTVFPGETFIVSIAPTNPHSPTPYFHEFTSRHSLHPLEYRDEIISILRPRRPSIADSTPTPSPSPTPTPSPSPTPTPSPTPQPSRFSAALYDPEAGANIQLTNIEVTLPEDFIADMHNRDNLNTTFLQDEMHRL